MPLLLGGGGRRRFGGGVPLNFINIAINFINDTVDRLREWFSVFHLFDLTAEEIHGLENDVKELRAELLGHHLDCLLPDHEEQVLNAVGHRHQRGELHHGGGALHRVHDAEDLVDAVLRECVRLFSGQKNPVQLLEKSICLVQIHI